MRKSIFLLYMVIAGAAIAQDKNAYPIYDAEGKTVTWAEMSGKCSSADMVFFGEEHNNPVCHWLELELFIDLQKAKTHRAAAG